MSASSTTFAKRELENSVLGVLSTRSGNAEKEPLDHAVRKINAPKKAARSRCGKNDAAGKSCSTKRQKEDRLPSRRVCKNRKRYRRACVLCKNPGAIFANIRESRGASSIALPENFNRRSNSSKQFKAGRSQWGGHCFLKNSVFAGGTCDYNAQAAKSG